MEGRRPVGQHVLRHPSGGDAAAFAGQIHGIQQIDFNTTAEPGDKDYGLLYVASGDGGIGVVTDDPQNLANPYGKILRIDPLGTNGRNGQYGVPASNPFVGQEGAVGEIYSYGMRDPHRFSWDAKTGKLYLGHIGQHAIEAVYEVRAGDNLGWSVVEGRYLYDNSDECNLYTIPDDVDTSDFVFPVASFDHDPPAGWPCTSDSGHAISGGLVYRGNDLKGLGGKYVFGDLVTGEVLYTQADEMRHGSRREATIHEAQLFDTDGNRLRMTDFVDDPRVDLRFGTDSDRKLDLLAKANGMVWKSSGPSTCRGRRRSSARSKGTWCPTGTSSTRSHQVGARRTRARRGPCSAWSTAARTCGPMRVPIRARTTRCRPSR